MNSAPKRIYMLAHKSSPLVRDRMKYPTDFDPRHEERGTVWYTPNWDATDEVRRARRLRRILVPLVIGFVLAGFATALAW